MAKRIGRRIGESGDGMDPQWFQRILPGLNALLSETVRSRLSDDDVQPYRLKLANLASLGIGRDDCRDLIAMGAVAVLGPLKDSSRICLTAEGLALMKTAIPMGAIRPVYEIASRELRVGGQLVLDLATQAHNLKAVLKSMELARWASRVTGALSGTRGGNDPHHLTNAVFDLNTLQRVIQFRTDDGAVCWKWR